MNSYAKQERSSIRAILVNARRSFISVLGALSIVLLSSLSTFAQVSTAQVSGLLKDNAGAILPGVKVTVVDKQTGKETIGSTNENGYYVVSNLPPGVYDVRIEVTGFKKYLDEGITLSAGDRVNISPAMEVGAVTEVVSVTSAGGDNVETENATVGQLIDGEQVRNLSLNGRNLMTLLNILPGVALTNDEVSKGGMAYGSVGDFAVNGVRSTGLNVTIDGGSNQDSGNITSLTNNVSVDFVGEVKVATSTYSAEYGRYNGAHINLSIRRGGKNYHGTLWEFFRNDVLNARSFFAPKREVLRMNHFGWNLGGPVYIPGKFNEDKKKLFFFGGQEYKRRIDGDTRRASIPTRAHRRGDFSGLTSSARFYYPANFSDTKLRGTAIAGRILPDKYITPAGRAMMSVYDEMEKLAVEYKDENKANNITFQEANRDIRRQDLLRLDYILSNKNNFSVRYLYDTGSNYNPYESGNIPTRRATRRNQATNIQFTWNTTLNSSTINELSVVSNYLYLERFPDTQYTDMSRYGLNIKEGFGNEMYELGMPEFAMNGYTRIYGGRGNPRSPVWDGSIRDNFSKLIGSHHLKLGTLLIRNRKNERASGYLTGNAYYSYFANINSTYDSSKSTSRSTSANRKYNGVMDLLLGNYREYTEGTFDKFSYIRYGQYDAYVADTWKALPNLTLDFGLRYSYMGAPYEKNNTIATFDPSSFDFANAKQVIKTGVNIGKLAPGGKAFNGIVVGGSNFPNPDVVHGVGAAQNLFGSLPGSIMSSKNTFSPRFGFSWDPFKQGDFVLRGGAGIYPGFINLVSVTAGSNPPFSSDTTIYNGNISNLAIDETAVPVQITGIDPKATFPVIYNWSFGFQKKLPSKVLLDVNYVSTQGRHLFRRPDINKVTPWDYDRIKYDLWQELKKTNKNLALGDVDLNLNAARKYQGYTSIYMYESSASSSYNGLQLGVSRRYAKDLTLSFAYTFSKALTDASTHTSGVEDLTDYSQERSHASYDRNHVLTASWIYNLPFYKDQRGFLGQLAGGWTYSGSMRKQQGAWITVTYSPTTGARRLDLIRRIQYLDPKEEGNYFFNTEDFVTPPADRWGTSAPNNLRGPGFHAWDMAFYKTFKTTESTKLQLRIEAFNVFNQVNFHNPNTNDSDGAFGTLSDSKAPREIQIALKFNF